MTTIVVLVRTGDDPRIEVIELRTYARDLADHLVTGFPALRSRRSSTRSRTRTL